MVGGASVHISKHSLFRLPSVHLSLVEEITLSRSRSAIDCALSFLCDLCDLCDLCGVWCVVCCVLCVVVLSVLLVVCGVVLCCFVWCGLACRKPSVCRFKTPPCVRSRRLRVYREFSTHTGVFQVHTETI